MKTVLLTLVVAALAAVTHATTLSETVQEALQEQSEGRFCNYYCPFNSEQKKNLGRRCARNILDCECDDGYNKDLAKDDCVRGKPEQASCDYLCPIGSHRTTNYCAKNFNDCKCKAGYKERFGECVCVADFRCPQNSHRKDNRPCYRNMNDCKCDPGYWLQRGKCVPKPECNYICPSGSHRTTSGCPKGFHHCKCKTGYERKWGKCVPESDSFCDYKCPLYSSPKHGVSCPKTFLDCQCDFLCPEGSHRTTSGCARDFDDCACKDGYMLDWRGEACVCNSDYRCPRNSERKPNRKCYKNFDDCQCHEGYKKQGNRCRYDHSWWHGDW